MRFSGLLLLLAAGSVAVPLVQQQDIVPKRFDTQCTVCKFIADMLHNLWGEESTEECLGEFFVYICTQLHIEDHFICKGIVGDFKDDFLWVVGQLIINPNEICGLLITDCATPTNFLNATWHIPLPGTKPPVVPPKPPVDKGKTLRVLQLSDIHLDMHYVIGSEAKCSEPQCCRNASEPDELIGFNKNIAQPAGYWGTVGKCDAPYWLFTNMLQHAQKVHTDLDYILVSGDLMSHADWDYTRPSHAAMVKNISDTIRSYFPKIPVYFAVGNHEGVPIDNFAPRFTPERFHMDWLYDTMADSWKGWVPEDQDATVRFNGCYMVKVAPGLRLISVNTPLGGDAVNFFLYVNQTDPDGTMTWFINQLYEAEKVGDKVHVVAHIPGSDSECLEGWAINYYDAINRFQNTVVVQFFGHTHSEQFYTMYADPQDATTPVTGVIYSAPSITTYSAFNPAYRVYTIDGAYPGSTFGIIDFEEWFFDLEKNTDQNHAAWEVLYSSVLKEYGLKSTNPVEWDNMIERMKTDRSLFEKYRKNFYRSTKINEDCDDECRMNWLCDCRKAHHSDTLCRDLNGATGQNRPPMYTKPQSNYVPTMTEALLSLNEIRANDKCKV